MKKDLTILYVEDEETVRENFTEILEDYFSKVLVANNGQDALALYDKYKPDIALLDISIPLINGLNVASKIRENNSEIQIVMLTAYADKDKLLQAVNLQLFAYLIKPVQHKEFDLTIEKLINTFETKDMLLLEDEFKWDKYNSELFYKDIHIKLTNNERMIISLLCTYPYQYFTAYDISLEISPTQGDDDKKSNAIIQILSRFKKKMSEKFSVENFFIQNTYATGYKIRLRVK